MAVGDVVNDIFTLSALNSFQPAATVGICITSFLAANSVAPEYMALTDGVTRAIIGDGVTPYGPNSNTKYMIDNTNYITCRTSALGGYYTGIQIK